jgi:hypothetical protein
MAPNMQMIIKETSNLMLQADYPFKKSGRGDRKKSLAIPKPQPSNKSRIQ